VKIACLLYKFLKIYKSKRLMVKIESRRKPEEINTREKLEEITREEVGESFLHISSEHNFIFWVGKNSKKFYNVNTKENCILITSKECFNFAIYLANEYEKITGEEWILKKAYYD